MKRYTSIVFIILSIISCHNNNVPKNTREQERDLIEINKEIEDVINSEIHEVRVNSSRIGDTLIVAIHNQKDNNFCGLMIPFFVYENLIFKKAFLFKKFSLVQIQLNCKYLPDTINPLIHDYNIARIDKIISKYNNNPNYLEISNYMLDNLISPDYSEIWFAHDTALKKFIDMKNNKIEDIIYGASLDKDLDIKQSENKKYLFVTAIMSRELQFENAYRHLKVIMDMCDIDTSALTRDIN